MCSYRYIVPALFLLLAPLAAQRNEAPVLRGPGNKPERLEWFQDQGFGLFIHWSVDSQLGSVISHSLPGASLDYRQRYFRDLPGTFNPRKFYPQDWAVLAKLAGIKYVVFTTKHHNGFAMWRTDTVDFGLKQTPFRGDITGDIIEAFRQQGIATGFYFSPDDFLWLHRNNISLQRNVPNVQPSANPGLLDLDKRQMQELLTRYGNIDVLFFDGEADALRQQAWKLQPDVVVTRGAIATPEQYVPGARLDGPWESCITMGTQWQYKPTNDVYKSGRELISLLIETRAKGGNLLLNVGPKPDGELPIEQEERLREIALWMFVNGESIYATRPWVVPNEGEYFFTKKKNEDTLYVFVNTRERWPYATWRDITLRSVKLKPGARISVLGQNDEVVEYQPAVVPKTTFKQEAQGITIRAMRAQRLYNDRKWPNPVVLKIEGAVPAFTPPSLQNTTFRWDAATQSAVLSAELVGLGNEAQLPVTFEYRSVKGMDLTERAGAFTRLPAMTVNKSGRFEMRVSTWKRGDQMEFRAVVKHPMLEVFGLESRANVP